MMLAHTYQRFLAFILDFLIISVIASFLTFWIPTSKEYEEAYKKEMDVVSNYLDGEIESAEFESTTRDLTYTINKERIIISLVDLVVTIAYFGTYVYYCDGQTIGKRVMKIKIVSNDDTEASHIQLFGRALLINGCLSSFLEILSIFLFTKDLYFSMLTSIEFCQFIFLIVSVFMFIYRKDKRGLHDLIVGTKVVKV